MTLKDEEKILRKAITNYDKLTAAELTSKMIIKLKPQVRAKFMEANRHRMRYCLEAEENLNKGRVKQAIELLEYALSKACYGNEYPLGVMGDAYMKKGDIKIALEFYDKSGSHDSLKKARQIRYKEGNTYG
jgi:tetratricopeptide (TPR) repeat protein